MASDEFPTTDELLDVFARAGRDLPADALYQAAEHWPDHVASFLALLQDVPVGAEITATQADILFYVIFLMAQQRETRAYAPLCALALQGDQIESILGDTITEHLSYIFARLYDGDLAPLRSVIESAEADQFARAAALGALVPLTLSGELDRDETATYLDSLFNDAKLNTQSYLWVGWLEAILALGFDHLKPRAKAAFDQGMIDEIFMDYDDFLHDLEAANDAARCAERIRKNLSQLDDIAELFSTWHYYSSAPASLPELRYPAGDMSGRTFDEATAFTAPQDPVRNPLRNVGRNDPCPCGSGKKFKKCCLGKS